MIWKSRPPFHFVNNQMEFKKWYQEKMIGAVIEVSGSKIIHDASQITGISYMLQRHWTCGPLYDIIENFQSGIRNGIYISFLVKDAQSVFINQIQKCFPLFKMMPFGSSSQTIHPFNIIAHDKFCKKRLKPFNEYIIFQENQIQKNPIFDTLKCGTGRTIQFQQRNGFGKPFVAGWNKLFSDQNKYMMETKVNVTWKCDGHVTNPHFGAFYHSLIIDYFFGYLFQLKKMNNENVFIQHITLVSEKSFLQLKFVEPLAYDEYVENYTLYNS